MTHQHITKPLEHAANLTGSAFIGVATSATQYVETTQSIANIRRRPGDVGPVWQAATKGYEARQTIVEKFLDSPHAWLLFVDGDMTLPPDALERLRGHGLPCVSGLYYRRRWHPTMAPIWYEDDPEFRWPLMFFRGVPQPGRLYRLGATGYGCWLIHRSVFEALAPLLKGEDFIIEDDMDVWPYDLEKVLAGDEQLRPLRGTKDVVGSDIRLSFFIRQAGFTIWGDPAVECGHFVDYPLRPQDWAAYGNDWHADFAETVTRDIEARRA